jgi:hypothetical protein
LVALSDLEIIRMLADEANGQQAGQELHRRGFSPQEVWVAATAVDGDPDVREQLARTLPEMTGIDARFWLLWLSRDASAQVRSAAIRWLATSTDPRIQEQLRELAERETDEMVRQALRAAPAIR